MKHYFQIARRQAQHLWARTLVLPLWQKIAILVVVGAGVIAVVHFTGSTKAEVVEDTLRSVTLMSVHDLSLNVTPLSTVGSVSALSQATIMTQKSGTITSVHYALGDYVNSGAVLATIDNASERAALLSAQGAYDAATANFDKVKGGTREEQLAILDTTTNAALANANAALFSAYSAVNSAIKGTTDPLFSNPESNTPTFNILATDSQLKLNAESGRVTLGATLAREVSAARETRTAADIIPEIDTTVAEVRAVLSYVDTVVRLLNGAISNTNISAATIAADVASVSGARTSLNSTLQTLTNAKSSLITAQQGQAQGVKGAVVQDVKASEASQTQAAGALASARANLEKTILRAPISGTLNTFSLKKGDFISANTPVAVVANNGDLEVVTYATEEDSRVISIGMKVHVEGSVIGRVSRLSPALDPISKKIEVRISVPRSAGFINGQSVIVSFPRQFGGKKLSELTVPIAAIKVGADATYVYTVSTSSTAVAVPVILGELRGDTVVIQSGVDADTDIITDARGLREGEKVSIRQ